MPLHLCCAGGAAATNAAPPSWYFGSVQGQPTRLAPAASGRNTLFLRCSASGGDGAGGPEPVLEEQKRLRDELSARTSSGEFTAQGPGWLAKLGPPGALAAGLLKVEGVSAARRGPELPQVAGSLAAGDAIFLPLYDHFLTHGGVFRLNLGPKSFVIVSDPDIAKHILRDNSRAYSKGLQPEEEAMKLRQGTEMIRSSTARLMTMCEKARQTAEDAGEVLSW